MFIFSHCHLLWQEEVKECFIIKYLMHLWLPLAIACERQVYFVKLQQTENLFCFCLCNENKNLSSFTLTLSHSNHLMLLDFSVSLFAFISLVLFNIIARFLQRLIGLYSSLRQNRRLHKGCFWISQPWWNQVKSNTGCLFG